MSEFMFGTSRTEGKVSTREAKRRDRICRKLGGYGWTQFDESHGTAHGGRWVSWYSGPNQGDPFDSRLAREVMDAVAAGCA